VTPPDAAAIGGATRTRAVGGLDVRRLDLASAQAWLLPFFLIAYLAFAGGGYDPLVRGQVGVAVWWIVIVGLLVGAIQARATRLGWLALGLLAAFAVWSGISLAWTESTSRTVAEIGRITTYLGVFALAVASQQRTSARHALNGAACAIALVAGVAVLSRLQPQLFSEPELARRAPGGESRLMFPLNYWNLLAGFAAMGVPLLLGAASAARSLLGRALAGAAVPIVALCVYLTVSRGGALALAACVAVFLLLAPSRISATLQVLVVAAGSAILCAAVDERGAVQDGLRTQLARDQGVEMLLLCLAVCVGVGLLSAAIGLADRHAGKPRLLSPSPRRWATIAAVLGAGAFAVFAAAGGLDEIDQQVQEFKAPKSAQRATGAGDDVLARLRSLNGGGRWQYWQTARAGADQRPLGGTGAGTFELAWARDGDPDAADFVRDAHSLWFQTLGETGIIGLALVALLFALALGAGAARALRATTPGERAIFAGATGCVTAFAVTSTFEWAWQMAVLPVAVLVVIAVIVTGRRDPQVTGRDPQEPAGPRRLTTGIAAAVGVVGAIAVAVPLAGAGELRDSQRQAARGNVDDAYRAAQKAEAVQPYLGAATLQRALLLEQAGALDLAAQTAREAAADDSAEWRVWYVLARLEARAGNADRALAAYRRARSLNPNSPIFER